MKFTRAQFFQLVAGGSAWLVSSGFAQKIKDIPIVRTVVGGTISHQA